MVTLVLPWPPTVNSYWRHVRCGRGIKVLVSEKGRKYRQTVANIAIKTLGLQRQSISGRLRVEIAACPADRRVRDLDNILKSLLDAITHAGVWSDDGAIDDLHIIRVDDPELRGMVHVCVQPFAAKGAA